MLGFLSSCCDLLTPDLSVATKAFTASNLARSTAVPTILVLVVCTCVKIGTILREDRRPYLPAPDSIPKFADKQFVSRRASDWSVHCAEVNTLGC